MLTEQNDDAQAFQYLLPDFSGFSKKFTISFQVIVRNS